MSSSQTLIGNEQIIDQIQIDKEKVISRINEQLNHLLQICIPYKNTIKLRLEEFPNIYNLNQINSLSDKKKATFLSNLINEINKLPSQYVKKRERKTFTDLQKSITTSMSDLRDFILKENLKIDPFHTLYNEFKDVIEHFTETEIEFKSSYENYKKRFLENKLSDFENASYAARLKFKLLDIYVWCRENPDKKKDFELNLKEKLQRMGLVNENGSINNNNYAQMKADHQYSFALTRLHSFIYDEIKLHIPGTSYYIDRRGIKTTELNNLFKQLECNKESTNLYDMLKIYLDNPPEPNEEVIFRVLKQRLLYLSRNENSNLSSNLKNTVVNFLKSPEPYGLNLDGQYGIKPDKIKENENPPSIFNQPLELNLVLTNYISEKRKENPVYNAFLSIFAPSSSADIKISAATKLMQNYETLKKYKRQGVQPNLSDINDKIQKLSPMEEKAITEDTLGKIMKQYINDLDEILVKQLPINRFNIKQKLQGLPTSDQLDKMKPKISKNEYKK